MGKKKFIDKKKAVTFQLLARDTSDPSYGPGPENDRVFIRVDNNPVSFAGFDDCTDDQSNATGFVDDPDSVFADAPGDVDDDEVGFIGQAQTHSPANPAGGLPDHIRREILELGFPDDGYNYLFHLREIRNSGGGSFYYQNPKANLEQLPLDVKAYDASRVRVNDAKNDMNEKMIYTVAEKTHNVRVQKALDPEVVALLEDDGSRFGSDAEDLEEDFIVQANLPVDGDYVVDGEFDDSKEEIIASVSGGLPGTLPNEVDHLTNEEEGVEDDKPRIRRLIDVHFDQLELQEYGTDSDEDYARSLAEKEESLAEKLKVAIKDALEIDDCYRAPAELLHAAENPESRDPMDPAAVVLRRCSEYAERYQNTDEDDREVIIMEESSDESKTWDCETIITTYSNLDNHPGRIDAPEMFRKNKLSQMVSDTLKSSKDHLIFLGGKEKMPVGYFPQGKRATKEMVKVVAKTEHPKRIHHGQESKEEKKVRKAAVKEERREARRLNKEVKELYRGEAKLAQKVAAISGPPSIHLM
ncbi:hypothetical protein Dimus_003110 [Dionaea muscipula]